MLFRKYSVTSLFPVAGFTTARRRVVKRVNMFDVKEDHQNRAGIKYALFSIVYIV